jgi:hypothetical protein
MKPQPAISMPGEPEIVSKPREFCSAMVRFAVTCITARAIVAKVCAYVAAKVAPIIDEYCAEGLFPFELLELRAKRSEPAGSRISPGSTARAGFPSRRATSDTEHETGLRSGA